MRGAQLDGKNILITGAAGNLGTALSLAFGKRGATILGIDLKQENLDSWRNRMEAKGIKAVAQTCDLTNQKALEDAVTALKIEQAKIDILINNAGITHIELLAKVKDPEVVLRKVMEVNLFAAANITNLVLGDLIASKGGIINISSVAGFAPLIGRTAYAASKHALHGYFESLRNELYDHKVGVLMVCPSFIAANPEYIDPHLSNENSIYQKKKTLGQTIAVDDLAEKIVKASALNKKRLVVGQAGKISYFLRRFFPNHYERLMRNKLKNEL
jgi:short-subunit dehydrogenase